MTKPKLMGLNHVALEVDDVDAAFEFYGKVFNFQLRGSHRDDSGVLQMAFVDMGDPFLALSRGRTQENDRSIVMDLATAAGATVPDGRPFNFLDPETISKSSSRDIQFTKSTAVLKALGIAADKTETKTETEMEEMRKKGICNAEISHDRIWR
ncbi:lactoylglutathione lyase-like lyase [Rhizobium leguminosarum bv. trifolii WSM597]|uniref:Lactoylglutathione lyase-like lyase n=1 Tax=Rhizobium leguminosarum bv. trifolii WSM597 TaxID=754764 RepID=I9N1U8_RHILT|nr:VOC family protein [Rhizobium leguminosarum]EJB01824.1 lactoylglutathione lyase-like lyase [Rhizobium leguminosarum bv. trifolii WSM597]